MSLNLIPLLGLVLRLGQVIHTQDEVLPRPSICAKPDTVVPRGRLVTIVCQSSAGADIFCLEKDRRVEKRDQRNVSQHGSRGTEARFHITASEVTAGRYFCRVTKWPNWSEPSELLELVVTDEDVSALPSGLSQALGPCPHSSTVHSPPTLLLTPSPSGSPAPLHTRPLAVTPGLGPWSPGPT
ncbi:LOW QUALITY PROTEIN: leukocyte-associated immunoglobulin-like receptor 2 [Pteropus vampyrus]|uniref:LOW QUALITY PROTEIN: leukocyte-associated immunoglobulin-like receptor 2 n=1 Tax=Pteropus vampyrus TaxID=132908 RepID=A0A6P6C5W6_PTEVA|nr:LOW QUALITY PROTEIN: leukocyte-associated immunoglobulin-like receptor 2 [Pteropus vampyrus]